MRVQPTLCWMITLLRTLLRPRILSIILIALIFESLWNLHTNQRGSNLPPHGLDRPFQHGCKVPDEQAKRANATILMLARNEDVEDALQSIISLERHFNRWFKYPVLFLNNQPWSEEFIASMSANITSGEVSFEVIPQNMWSIPEWMNTEDARKRMRKQQDNGVFHGAHESYHHMCRFYSGFFFDIPALQKYRWYWRIEPDARYTCAITYDPFVEMEKHDKKYGYTMALWEIGKTAPSLFKLVSQFKAKHQLKSTPLWRAMVDVSWLPWPFRGLTRWLPHRNTDGETWNMCHFWSNFEIADLDFFRSKMYRDFFEYLDQSGGFYHERFGDAPIHSLAAALFLKPRELHHFEDFGYTHSNLWVQPHNALGEQLPGEDLSDSYWAEEEAGGIGCRCERPHGGKMNFPDTCIRQLGPASIRTRP